HRTLLRKKGKLWWAVPTLRKKGKAPRLGEAPRNGDALLGRVVRTRPPPPDDGGIGRLPLVACLAALGEHAGGAARVPAAGRPALAAAHRVAHRVHRRAAVVRPASH